ncbi:MAG: universal stress protein [Caldimonas sp.]
MNPPPIAEVQKVHSNAARRSILKDIKAAACDLVVIGTHGRRGFRRALLGSDAEAVLRESPVSVLLVRSPEKTT